MKVTAIETINLEEYPNVLWVQVHTDEGIVGLGETFYAVEPAIGHVHQTIAPYLLGQNPLQIDKHSRHMLYNYLGFKTVGAEMRAASAVDIALWDILGQVTNQPIYQLLGGASRDKVRAYNTCAGYQYVRAKSEQGTANFGMPGDGGKYQPYEDLVGFMKYADELALSLLEEGYTGMKIWPFDEYAEASNGTYISTADLKKAMVPFEKIRKAVGDKMDIHVEFHSLWNLPQAKRIARALAEFEPYWLEDPVKMDNVDVLCDYAAATPLTVCGSETLGTRAEFRAVIERRAVGVVMFDVAWVGGISEARKVAAMAETHHLPVAPHDATGPVTLIAGNHVVMNAPNGLVQEIVRSYYATWYRDIVTALPVLERGVMFPLTAPGLGTQLQDSLLKRADARIRSFTG
ncbi:MAG: mandelate racemase/muconate lactonizing enzyme family protein [Burkholderiales bacterium]|nr:mandelate racemase/muconate lactonizing enzyme family protein [Burkholderiales bacterium]